MLRARRKSVAWAAPCRDEAGRRRKILVLATDDDHVALVFPPGAVAVLEPLQAGRLRAALRDVVYSMDDRASRRLVSRDVPVARMTA
jgi:hypothetical protein